MNVDSRIEQKPKFKWSTLQNCKSREQKSQGKKYKKRIGGGRVLSAYKNQGFQKSIDFCRSTVWSRGSRLF